MQHIFAMANHVTALLNGATDPDPSQHGMTTEEERASSSKPQVSCSHQLGCSLCQTHKDCFKWIAVHQHFPASETGIMIHVCKRPDRQHRSCYCKDNQSLF